MGFPEPVSCGTLRDAQRRHRPVHLSPTDRQRRQAIVDDRNSPQKHVWRARIVLATAGGLGASMIMRTAGVSKTAVWRWQTRFMDEGVAGLLRRRRAVVALTFAEPPGETTAERSEQGQILAAGPRPFCRRAVSVRVGFRRRSKTRSKFANPAVEWTLVAELASGPEH